MRALPDKGEEIKEKAARSIKGGGSFETDHDQGWEKLKRYKRQNRRPDEHSASPAPNNPASRVSTAIRNLEAFSR